MGFYLRGHRGSGDHGCEDRLRGICSLLPEKPEVYSRQPGEDWHYGIGKLAALYRSIPGAPEDRLEPGDWLIDHTPGNVKDLRRRGIHPLLVWDGSQEPPGRRLLSQYEAVAVTERRSRRTLKRWGLTNAVLVPEPAFQVKPRPRSELKPDTVALCLNYPAEAGELLYQSYRHLMGYILNNTGLNIALISYCVQRRQSDLPLARALYRQFRDTGRVCRREDGDSPTLRGDICQCSCCVGGDGAVAAWGCGVPALCLSATCRTKGLSQAMLGTWQDTVVPWQELKTGQDLTERFLVLLRHQDRHRQLLETNLERQIGMCLLV